LEDVERIDLVDGGFGHSPCQSLLFDEKLYLIPLLRTEDLGVSQSVYLTARIQDDRGSDYRPREAPSACFIYSRDKDREVVRGGDRYISVIVVVCHNPRITESTNSP